MQALTQFYTRAHTSAYLSSLASYAVLYLTSHSPLFLGHLPSPGPGAAFAPTGSAACASGAAALALAPAS